MTGEPCAAFDRSLSRHFADAMSALGPFEARAHIAVAVSGGPDSMALALLARQWISRRRGEITALTIDHGLRPESAREAQWVKKALRKRGIAHRVLPWRPGRAAGQGNLQAAARAARYRLMSEWCRAKGVLHLLTAHHLDDQAETFLLRLGRGSGLYGLACMAGVSEHHDVRLLRPVLGVPREDLTAYLVRAGQDWVEDPSNADPAFARVRMRAALPGLAEDGITAARIGATTARLARDRVSLEREVARLLAATVRPDPAGFVQLDLPRFLIAPDGVALRALSRLLAAVGGLDYGPRFERLERLYAELKVDARPRTLGGCIVMPSRRHGLLICREAAAQAPSIEISAPGTLIWDDRFHVRIRAVKGGAPGAPMTLGPLGRDGWARIKPDKDGFVAGQGRPARVLPAVVRSGLPALSDARGVLEVPHLGYRRCVAPIGSLSIAEIWPMPPQPMAAAGFGVIGGRDR